MMTRITWLFLLLQQLSYAATSDSSYCQGAFWIRPDDQGNDLYVYARNVTAGMILPPHLVPSFQNKNETPPEQEFMIMLQTIVQHNFGIQHDAHTVEHALSVTPFIWNDLLEFLRLKQAECNATWTETESSQVTRMAFSILYRDIEGMNGLTNWVHPLRSYCTWKGIRCDDDWKLQELSLTHMSLRGTLPTELGLIPALPVLDVTGNRLYGTIPLYSNVRHLDVSGNQFTAVSWELSNHDSAAGKAAVMEYLDVSANNLSGTFPDRWNQQLAHLKVLDASRNALRGTVSFSENQAQHLEMLFLGSNLFTGTLPQQLPESLKLLDVGQNLLTGSIPAALWPTLLETVILADNQLTGDFALDSFASMSHLEVLQLQNNHLRGSIPAVVQWSELGTLSIRSNAFTGSIPAEFMMTVQQNLQS